MFDLPKGITVEEEIDVSEGVIQPFTHGVISIHLERHVVRSRWCRARAVGRALSEAGAQDGVPGDGCENAVVVVVGVAALLT